MGGFGGRVHYVCGDIVHVAAGYTLTNRSVEGACIMGGGTQCVRAAAAAAAYDAGWQTDTTGVCYDRGLYYTACRCFKLWSSTTTTSGARGLGMQLPAAELS